jgi:hypothetical protein
MASGTLRTTVSPGADFRRAIDALRITDETLAERLRDALVEAVKPLVDKSREDVMALAVHGIKHTGLRARVAAGVGTRITRDGVTISASMNRAGEASLPAYLDADNGWRHPVYGNRHVWVLQTTGGEWFAKPFEEGQEDLADALHEVLEDVAQEVHDAAAGD